MTIKVLVKLFQKLAVSKCGALGRRPQTAKSLPLKRFSRGEFYNSPVDCCKRGDALQVKAFPPSDLIYNKVFLQAEQSGRLFEKREIHTREGFP